MSNSLPGFSRVVEQSNTTVTHTKNLTQVQLLVVLGMEGEVETGAGEE